MSLSLSKKAIILVAVPLAFEIVFVVSLAVLLHQVGIERERENQAREITAHVNAGLVALLDRFSSCILYHVSDSPVFRRRFDLARERIQAEIGYMRRAVVESPEDRKRLQTIQDLLNGSAESLQKAQGQLEQGDKIGAARQWIQSDRVIGRLLKSIDDISQSTQKSLDDRKAAQEAYVRMVEQLLIAGVVFNILLAVALAMSFNRGTSNRLKVLVDNTVRLAIDKPLSAPLSGNDEMAKLDHTFREMAEALAESRMKERAVVDNAADVICSVDRDGILEVNPAATRHWGYSREELLGKNLSDFVVEGDRQSTKEAMSALIAGGEPGVFENRILTKGGEALDFSWSAHWSPKEKALFLVARDISERKQIDRMKRDFVAMVSHDLRTPLTSIQMVLSLLEAEAYGQLNDAGHENLEAAEANVNRLIALVNGLLDLEKMESGKLELIRDTFKLSEIVLPAVSSVKGFAEQQKITIETGILPELSVFADKDRLVQVLVNLISNAIKFSPKPGTVEVQAEVGGLSLKVLVKDQGRGVPEEMRESIFERFKQVEASDQKIHAGSGLGLAICKAIVERHGGQIGVEPGASGGSVFWFTLPRLDQAVQSVL